MNIPDETIEAIVDEWWARISGPEIGDSRTALYRTLRHHLQADQPSPAGCDEAFEQWWKVYPRCPRKIRKKKSMAIWRRLWKADDLPGIPSMLSTLEFQKRQWESDEWEYVPLPQTYLNGAQWEDEVQGPRVIDVRRKLPGNEWM